METRGEIRTERQPPRKTEQQPFMEPPTQQKEHQWLQKLIGEWTYEGEASMGPEKPTQKFNGTERVRSLGGLWILAEGEGEIPGGGVAKTLMTLGYDPQKKRFVGTFFGTMMTNLWIYEGTLDAAGRKLVLDSKGPSMGDPTKLAEYRDSIELKSDDQRLFTSQVMGDDGKFTQFTSMTYRRKS